MLFLIWEDFPESRIFFNFIYLFIYFILFIYLLFILFIYLFIYLFLLLIQMSKYLHFSCPEVNAMALIILEEFPESRKN